jgi:arsenate reductase
MMRSRKKRVLFVCIQNSARSQMAEAIMNQMCSDEYQAHSAGLSPGDLNPLAVEVMREAGIDISTHGTQSVFDVFKLGTMFAYVVTVCDQVSAERCPIFPGVTTRLHWSFPDPAGCEGTHEEKLQATREVRDMIKAQIEEFCTSICQRRAA